MIALTTILLIIALILFILATIPVKTRINLVPLGLAFVTLAAILAGHLIAL
jgi:hypothetical protein